MYEIYSKLLKEKKMTSYKIASITGVSQSTISDWKAGRHHPKEASIEKIADALGTTAEYILTGDESKKDIKKETTQTDGLNEIAEIMEKLSPDDRKRLAEFGKALLASSHNPDI